MTRDPGAHNSLGDALVEVVRSLRREPPLLFGLGMAILLAILSIAGSGDLRTVTLPVLAISVVALAAWIGVRARERLRTGKVHVDESARVDGKVGSGDIDAGSTGVAQTGDVRVGGNAQVGGTVGSGRIRTRG